MGKRGLEARAPASGEGGEDGLVFGGEESAGLFFLGEPGVEGGGGAGAEGVAFFLGAEAFGGAEAGAAEGADGGVEGAEDGVWELEDGGGGVGMGEEIVDGQAAAFEVGEDGEGDGYGFEGVGKGDGAGVKGDGEAGDGEAGVVGVGVLLGERGGRKEEKTKEFNAKGAKGLTQRAQRGWGECFRGRT